jgi:hypothetical protein
MSDRLNELRHQRSLAQEQLAWLDREIARETGDKETTPAVPLRDSSRQPAAAVSIPAPLAPKDIEAEAARILAQYQSKGPSAQDEARRGCLIYFFGAMILLILGLTAFIFWRYW